MNMNKFHSMNAFCATFEMKQKLLLQESDMGCASFLSTLGPTTTSSSPGRSSTSSPPSPPVYRGPPAATRGTRRRVEDSTRRTAPSWAE